ncbi:MAG: HNH endonuclease [Proteobacteria bacterium]|nr:MAG: HNH endonuclease [Pseudomonadota bacterium]
MSQKERRAVSTEESLFLLMSEFKRKHDPVLKAERAEAKNAVRTNKSLGAKPASMNSLNRRGLEDDDVPCVAAIGAMSSPDKGVKSGCIPVENSRYIPAAVRHKLALRDSGKCSFVDRHGKRCGSGRWVQKHHVQHFAEGGSHEVGNLETLCWAHHVMKHRH